MCYNGPTLFSNLANISFGDMFWESVTKIGVIILLLHGKLYMQILASHNGMPLVNCVKHLQTYFSHHVCKTASQGFTLAIKGILPCTLSYSTEILLEQMFWAHDNWTTYVTSSVLTRVSSM